MNVRNGTRDPKIVSNRFTERGVVLSPWPLSDAGPTQSARSPRNEITKLAAFRSKRVSRTRRSFGCFSELRNGHLGDFRQGRGRNSADIDLMHALPTSAHGTKITHGAIGGIGRVTKQLPLRAGRIQPDKTSDRGGWTGLRCLSETDLVSVEH